MTLAERIKELKAFLKTDEVYANFIETQLRVIKKELQVPGVAQPGDARDWWYLAEGRMGRACSLHAIIGDESLADWVHQSALMLARESADAWIGPFFRIRFTPLKGMLETGHLASAVAQPLIFTPDIFTEAEREELRTALREKAIAPLEEWLKPYYADHSLPHNNWVISELSGLFTAACALKDIALVRKYLPLFTDLHKDFNSDFYGEPEGYWDYTCSNFLKTHFILSWVFPELADEIVSPSVLITPFLWKYYRRQGTFMLQNIDEIRLRQLSFGDEATIEHTSDYIMLFVSIYHEDSQVRGLATALLEDKFIVDGGKEVASSRTLICMLPYRGKKRVAESVFPPSRLFADGFLMYKDRWENPSIQIALQGGHIEVPRVISHRHADQLSFQLAKDGIVILDDPSICCYRLNTYQLTRSAGWHSVPRFTTVGEDARLFDQINMNSSNIQDDRLCRRIHAAMGERAFTITAEAAELYPEEITSVRRTFAAVGENVLVIADSYIASEPVAQIASFIGNNRRRGMKWSFGDNSARMSREGVGVQIAAMQDVSLTLDYAALNDSNSTYPDSLMQGREGSGYIVRMQTNRTAESGRSIYVLFADREENLDNWSASLAGDTVTVFENGTERCTVTLGDTVSITEKGVNLLP